MLCAQNNIQVVLMRQEHGDMQVGMFEVHKGQKVTADSTGILNSVHTLDQTSGFPV